MGSKRKVLEDILHVLVGAEPILLTMSTDGARGNGRELKGKVREEIGKLRNNKKELAKGKIEQVEGKAREKLGKAQRRGSAP